MITSAPQCLRWIAAASLLTFTAVSFGQVAAPRPDRGDRDHGRRLSQVMKYKIFIQDDQPAGQVVDFVLSDGGCIDYIVAVHDDQYYVIPYSAATVRYADSLVFVDIAPSRFDQIQFFAADNWPDFYVPAYRDRIFTTFGVNAIRRDGRTTFRRDLDDDDDDAAERRERRDRREDARDRREDRRDDARERREDRRDDRRDRRDTDDDADRDRPEAKPAPKTKTPPRPDANPPTQKKDADPTPDTPRADPKQPTLPKNPAPKTPAPKLPTPKKPAIPKEPAPK